MLSDTSNFSLEGKIKCVDNFQGRIIQDEYKINARTFLRIITYQQKCVRIFVREEIFWSVYFYQFQKNYLEELLLALHA